MTTKELKKQELVETIINIKNIHLPRWEELPQFDIYMDQLITLLNQYLEPLCLDEASRITSSMVNNYVKLKMIPKPTKKKYQRIHIAYLIAITLLKQVLTIPEIKDGIELQAQTSGLKGAYNLFCTEMENALLEIVSIASKMEDATLCIPNFTSESAAMKLCTLSLAGKLITRIFLNYKKETTTIDQQSE